MTNTTETKIDQTVDKTAGSGANAVGDTAATDQSAVGSATQSTATLKDKILGAFKKLTGGA